MEESERCGYSIIYTVYFIHEIHNQYGKEVDIYMKWTKEVKHKPYHGDKRVISKFALLPIRCENGECAWFERVYILQQFRIDPYGHWVNEKLR